jgi:predicted transcriptional regulator
MALTVNVKLRIAPEMRDAVEKVAREQERSSSQIIRRAIREYLKQQNDGEEKVA